MAYLLACLLTLVWLLPAHAWAQTQPASLLLDKAQVTAGVALDPPDPVSHFTALPDLWHGPSTVLPQQRWYHLVFDDGGWTLPAVYLERACTNVEVWINGERVGSGGSMVEPLTRNCYVSHLFRFPHSLVQPMGNRLDIRVVGYPHEWVASRQRAGGLSSVRIGDQVELTPLHQAHDFWNVDLARVIGISIALVGFAMAALGWVRRPDRHALYFGLALVLWALMGTRLYVQHIPLPWRITEVFYTALYAPFAYAFLQFLLHYVRKPHRWVQQALLWQCVAIPLVLALVPGHWLAEVAVAQYVLLAAEFLAAYLYFSWHSWRITRRDFWVMGGVLLVLLFLAVLEVAIQSSWLDLPKVHLLHFAMPLIALAMGVRLVREFAAALAESERLNRELEQRVADKSAEIARSYQQLSEMRAEQAVSAERHRIASDLHDDLGAQLVTIAQASVVANDIGHVSELARKALADMRLSVRGLTCEPMPVADVLADWRRETVERLTMSRITAFWNATEVDAQWMLSSRLQVQLTRILREGVSNVIRHSGARHCWIDIHVTSTELQLGIEDDGQGFDAQQAVAGHGLRNLVTRAHSMAGSLHIEPREVGGTRIRVCVPLGADTSLFPSQIPEVSDE